MTCRNSIRLRRAGSCEPDMRLNLYLARGGVASRRSSDELIVAGRVTVNGGTVTRLGSTVEAGDHVCLDGCPVELATSRRYLALHKPRGFLCTAADPQGRRLAVELLANTSVRLFSVGRLDYRSSGLLLFTNDGRFAEHAAHPSYGVEKDYLVQSAGSSQIPDDVLHEYCQGLRIDGERYQLSRYVRQAEDRVLLTLSTGRNREIRRVFAAAGIELSCVHRLRIGPVRLGALDSGHHRELTDQETSWFLQLERQSSR